MYIYTRKQISLRFLYVSTFLAQMIMAAVALAVPIYANLLGAEPILLGGIGAAGGLTYTFVPLLSGMLSEKLKLKILISASMISYGFSCILYSLIQDPSYLLLVKALEWVSMATFWPSAEALLADTGEENLEEILRTFNVSWGSGLVIGPMVGGLLITGYGIKAPFFFAQVTSFSLGIIGLTLIEERPRESERCIQESPQEERRSVSRYSIVTAFSSVLLTYTIGGIILSLFPAYAVGLGISAYEIGLCKVNFLT